MVARLTIYSLSSVTICNFSYFPYWFWSRDLGSDCSSDNLFKLFCYITFSLQKYIPTHLNSKLVYGSVFLKYRLSNGQPILNLENLEFFA